MNPLAVVVAITATILAVRYHIKMRGIETRLKYQDFPHRKWDLENPISKMRWNSKGEPIYIWESRTLENSLRMTSKNSDTNRGFFGAIAILAWITAVGF